MAELTDYLTDIADSIRTKKGSTDSINAQDFATEIQSIQSGMSATPIEYIQGNNYGMMETDFVWNKNCKLEVVFAQDDFGGDYRIFSAEYTGTPYLLGNNNGTLRCYSPSNQYYDTPDVTTTHTAIIGDDKYILDGIDKGQMIWDFNGKIRMFNNGNGQYAGCHKIYSLKIWDENRNLARDYKPYKIGNYPVFICQVTGAILTDLLCPTILRMGDEV